MFVRAKKKTEDRWQVQIVETVVVKGQPRQKIVRNIGVAHSQREVADFKAVGELAIIEINNNRQPVLAFADPADFHAPKKRRTVESVAISSLQEEKRINKGFEYVMKPLFDELHIDLDDQESNEIVGSLVMARAYRPASKLKSKDILLKVFDLDIDLHKIYRVMDKLADKEPDIKKAIAQKSFDLLNNEVDIMFFDVTTLAFESQSADGMREFGYSKDCKFNEVQVVLAMVTTTDGLPVTYKLFPGNKFEGHTLIPVIEELKKEFKIQNVFLAADRGMFSKKNLSEMDLFGIKYVVSAKLKSMTKEMKAKILATSTSPEMLGEELIWIGEHELNERRLVVSYSSKRARKDRADRQRLIDRLLKKVRDGRIQYKDLISNAGSKKFITSDGLATTSIDFAKLEKEAEWDGMYGVVTNSDLSASAVMERYRGLWQIEESFRINKHTLKMRPIYHWNAKRIKGHICLCFITFALVRQIQFRLAQSGNKLSIAQFLEALSDVQVSVLKNKFSKKLYHLPSKLSENAKIIFDTFKLKRSSSIKPV